MCTSHWEAVTLLRVSMAFLTHVMCLGKGGEAVQPCCHETHRVQGRHHTRVQTGMPLCTCPMLPLSVRLSGSKY